MTKLSVNVNKLATLRNSRGKNNPDVLKTTLDIVAFGAQGITVHPRPDERHIRTQDVYEIARHIDVEFNIEGYPDQRYMDLVKELKPAQATLVPDPPHVLTSNAGWNIANNVSFLKEIIADLKQHGIRSSLFVDPQMLSDEEIKMLAQIGVDRVELYTEAYAESFGTDDQERVLKIYQTAAQKINGVGVDLNAGHDLNLHNLPAFIQAIPSIKEVSIGHALICDALYYGLADTVQRYLNCLD